MKALFLLRPGFGGISIHFAPRKVLHLPPAGPGLALRNVFSAMAGGGWYSSGVKPISGWHH